MLEAVRHLILRQPETERAGKYKEEYLKSAQNAMINGALHSRLGLDNLGFRAFKLYFAIKLADLQTYGVKKVVDDVFEYRDSSKTDRLVARQQDVKAAEKALEVDLQTLKDEHPQNALYLDELGLAANWLTAQGMRSDRHGNESRFSLETDLRAWEKMWKKRIAKFKPKPQE